MPENILELQNIVKTYPGVRALSDVSIGFRPGEVHAIVGENGAGKSTLIKTITGVVKPDSGTILFEGQAVTMDPIRSKKLGVGVIYQEFSLVPEMGVQENIFLGEKPGKNKLVADFKEMNARSAEIIAMTGVNMDPTQKVSTLTVGYQQIVEISRALSKDLKLLIMDEPSAPLTNNEIERLYLIIDALKKRGITIIYISHRMEEIFELSDRVSVMRDGQYITTINTADTNRQELISYMVGRELKETFPERTAPIGEEVLRAEHLTGNGVRDISFSLHKGEILGFAGLLGCGRTECLELIYGAKKRSSGEVYLNGAPVSFKNTNEAIAHGVGLIPEDRKKHGCFLDADIKWNTTISSVKKISRLGIVDKKHEREVAQHYVEELRVKTPSIDQKVGNLSGGNQQKVVIAKMLATDANIMMFDEPTRGIDVGAKQEIYKLIRKLAEEGKSIIVVSSEMEEVIGLSDRIVVLSEGNMIGILEKSEFSQERILEMASQESRNC